MLVWQKRLYVKVQSNFAAAVPAWHLYKVLTTQSFYLCTNDKNTIKGCFVQNVCSRLIKPVDSECVEALIRDTESQQTC